MSKNVLITGAAGFIGHHLYNRLLQRGDRVIGLDNFDHPCGAEIECIKGDVLHRTLIDELVREVDVVYHLASQIHVDRSYKEPELTFDVNVGGTENVIKACKEYGKQLVFASTSEIYGTAQTDTISEEHPLNPQSPYAKSKKEAEDLCIDYARRGGVEVIILRSFNTYGPFQNNNHYGAVIPIFIKRILGGESPEIFGSGLQTRDFMYISDALDAYDIAVQKAATGEPVNFGTGIETSINDLASILLRLMGSNLDAIHVEPRPNEVMRLRADISKARTLGFEPKVAFEDGLRMYLTGFKAR